MNTYHIPKSGSNKDYLELVESLAWVGLTSLNIDYAASLVHTDGTTTDPRAELLPAQSLPNVSTTIFKKDFIQRMSPYEYSGIKTLRGTDAIVDWLMAAFDATSIEIDLTSETLAMGFNYIASLPNSPLTFARVVEILEIK